MSDRQRPGFIFYSGDVRAMNPAQPQATAVFVRGGRVHAVGHYAQSSALVGSSTRRVDLRGNTLIPGLVDAHCRPTTGAIADLFSCKFEFTGGPDGIDAWVTRRDPHGRTAGALWPEQAISLEQALGIFTPDGAWALHVARRPGQSSPARRPI
jgi:predicted amidohydrolase YtcJ